MPHRGKNNVEPAPDIPLIEQLSFRPVPFDPHTPARDQDAITPEQIARGTKEIQAGWTDRQRQQRGGANKVKWRVPIVHCDDTFVAARDVFE